MIKNAVIKAIAIVSIFTEAGCRFEMALRTEDDTILLAMDLELASPFIAKIIEWLGRGTLSSLEGKVVRIRLENDVFSIGHIIENEWIEEKLLQKVPWVNERGVTGAD